MNLTKQDYLDNIDTKTEYKLLPTIWNIIINDYLVFPVNIYKKDWDFLIEEELKKIISKEEELNMFFDYFYKNSKIRTIITFDTYIKRDIKLLRNIFLQDEKDEKKIYILHTDSEDETDIEFEDSSSDEEDFKRYDTFNYKKALKQQELELHNSIKENFNCKCNINKNKICKCLKKQIIERRNNIKELNNYYKRVLKDYNNKMKIYVEGKQKYKILVDKLQLYKYGENIFIILENKINILNSLIMNFN